jgi:small subunit ribosomal protein S6
MDKKQTSYEVLYIVNLGVGDDALRSAIDKFTALIAENGEVLEVKEWGKRKFAYPINDLKEGYYVLTYFKSNPEFPEELSRRFGIDEAILRSHIQKLNEREYEVAVGASVPAFVTISSEDEDEAQAARRRARQQRQYGNHNQNQAPAPAPAQETAQPAEETAEAPTEASVETAAEAPTEAPAE